MTEPLAQRIPFAKIVIILACTFGLGIGLCGITAFAAGAMHGSRSSENFLAVLGIIDAALILLSAVGLVVSVIAWVVFSLTGRSGSNQTDPQTLFDSSHHDSNKPEDRP